MRVGGQKDIRGAGEKGKEGDERRREERMGRRERRGGEKGRREGEEGGGEEEKRDLAMQRFRSNAEV